MWYHEKFDHSKRFLNVQWAKIKIYHGMNVGVSDSARLPMFHFSIIKGLQVERVLEVLCREEIPKLVYRPLFRKQKKNYSCVVLELGMDFLSEQTECKLTFASETTTAHWIVLVPLKLASSTWRLL